MELVYCLLYLILSGVIIFFIGRIFPRKWLKEDKFPFKPLKFEKDGKIYEKLKIRKWKTKLPDASVIICKFLPNFMPKKRLENKPNEKIKILIKESCIAESTHLLSAIIGLYCIKIWKKFGIIISTVWASLHIPFIIIQRYNRPRLIKTASNFI